MPDSAARPVPTMIAVGVARPMAQGQAMMSTEMAATIAWVSGGRRAEQEPDAERDRRQEPAPGARTGR